MQPIGDRRRHVLELLCLREAMTHLEIAERVGMAPAQALTLLGRMASAYQVRKIRDGDRRKGFHGPSLWALREVLKTH